MVCCFILLKDKEQRGIFHPIPRQKALVSKVQKEKYTDTLGFKVTYLVSLDFILTHFHRIVATSF